MRGPATPDLAVCDAARPASAQAWAKRRSRPDANVQWHALPDHSADVAACLEALLGLPIISSRLAVLAGRDRLPHEWKQRLSAAAFLHDFGKANHKFQRGDGGHIREAIWPITNTAVLRASGLDALDNWGVDVRFLLAVALAHHGEPPELQGGAPTALSSLWQPTEEYDPVSQIGALVTMARAHWPSAFQPGGERFPTTQGEEGRFWHGFLGLLQLADWLGSDDAEDAFPYANGMADDRLAFARARASSVLRSSRLDTTDLRAAIPCSLDFAGLWGFAPHAIQRATAEAPGPVVVLEAETGSGKTEAALWRFAKLFQSGKVDGLYFALPTRIAATAMHTRVQDAADALFGVGSLEVVRALPGDAASGAAQIRLLPEFRVQWTDAPDAPTRRARWAAEHPKRFLAAPIGVGTIDQALLGAVCVKHAQMRSICLSRLLLVVDEVHASDTYMQHLLRGLLDQHRAAGGEALLLSATLGAAARTTLLLGDRRSAEQHPVVKDDALASGVAYPALSWIAGGELHTKRYASSGATKSVEVSPSLIIGDPHAIATVARQAGERGAKVLVVRNLVRDAIATARALHGADPDPALLFRLDGVPTLHHGRFARPDRLRLDAEVERVLGKRRDHEGGFVLIGTQTLEQSLDIDADLLITDLAPMDVLLQRIGRLHRHARRRPQGFAQPRVLVLVPESFDASLAAVVSRSNQARSGPHGLGGLIYGNLLSLAATRRAIGDGSVWNVPAMNRALVEAATHPAALGRLCLELGGHDLRWREAAIADAGKTIAQSKTAEMAAISWTKPAAMFRLAEEAIGTRLGARDIELPVDPALSGPFPGSMPITRLLIPAHLYHNQLPEPDSVRFSTTPEGIAFAFGDVAFQYTRYGLEALPGDKSHIGNQRADDA